MADIIVGTGPVGATVGWVLGNGSVGPAVVGRVVHTVGPNPVGIKEQTVRETFFKHSLKRLEFGIAGRFEIANRRHAGQLRIVGTTGLDVPRTGSGLIERKRPGQVPAQSANISDGQHSGTRELALYPKVELLDGGIPKVWRDSL